MPGPKMTVAEFDRRLKAAFPDAAVERNDTTGELVVYTGWVQPEPTNARKRLVWGEFLDDASPPV